MHTLLAFIKIILTETFQVQQQISLPIFLLKQWFKAQISLLFTDLNDFQINYYLKQN